MCSVQGCDSWRRDAECFDLPKDPQIRLQWIQFVSESNNGQLAGLLNESSCADITVCQEHFLEGCFEKPDETYCKVQLVRLRPSAVPTVRIKEEDVVTAQQVPCETESSNGHTQCIPLGVLQQDEQKPVNNNIVSELFPNTCPSCGHNLQTTTITQGMFITLTQQCLTCEYRNEFRREISASADEHQTSTGNLEVTKKEEQTDEYICESDTFSPTKDKCSFKEEKDSSDRVVSSEEPDLVKELHPAKDTEGKSRGKLVLDHPLTQQFCNDSGDQRCVHKSEPYVCGVCGKRCTNKVSLSRHVNTHDVNYEFQCIYCYETFKKKREKILHQQVHDYLPYPYKCRLCPETFSSRFERSKHLKTRHRNRKQSKCEICGFIFDHPHYLQRHMMIHTGDKPYKCSICERAFNQAGHLRSHMRLHTGERPFKCQHCDKAFNHNVSLKSHVQRYHKPDQTEPQQSQEKPLTNENSLFRFFPHQCPSCSSKLQTEKVTVGTLITLTQQCLQCEYRNEFTRQTRASTTENQSTPHTEPEQTDKLDNSETFALYKEESEGLIEEDSDEDWFPIKKCVPTKKSIEPCIQKGVLHQDEDKPRVNNNFVSELFPNTCRSCGYNLQTTTITQGMFITLTQQCPRCEYRVEFREINKSADERGTPTQSLEVTIKEEQTDDKFGLTEDECGAFKTGEKSCDSVATSDDLAKQQLPENDSEGKSQGPYVCNVCGKSCTNKGTLRRHVNTHDVNYEYQCIYCYETFKKKTEKLLHQQIHDYSPKPYKCLLCPETFPCRYERSYHLKTCHGNRKQSKCEICGFIFENRHYLQRHMVVHTGDKPYKCSICERAFNQAGHLRSHMRLHTGERPFKCQHCDKAFNHNVSLKSHVQRYHKPDQ